jgi:hypothetical protein
MQAEIRENTTTHAPWCVIHPLGPEDSAAMTALRSAVADMKGKLEGTAARRRLTASWIPQSARTSVTNKNTISSAPQPIRRE